VFKRPYVQYSIDALRQFETKRKYRPEHRAALQGLTKHQEQKLSNVT